MSQSNFKYLLDIYRSLRSAYLRLLQDTISKQSMFVYQYFTDDLLSLAQRDLPIAATKRILKDTLCGIAVLHDHNIVHTGILDIQYKECPWTIFNILQI